MDMQLIEKVKEIVSQHLAHDTTGHDYWHTICVYQNALSIAKQEQGNIDLLVVSLGALLHDIADHKLGYNDDDRCRIIHTILDPLVVDTETINHVIDIANTISFKRGTNKTVLRTIEAKIVQDADRLEAMGAIGIARAFSFGGSHQRALYNPPCDVSDQTDTISHFYEKLLLLKDLMNTETGKKRAQNRHDFMLAFLEEFYQEWEGIL